MSDIEKINALYTNFEAALREGDGAKCASMCDENAVLMPPNEPSIKGRDAIKNHFANLGPDSSVTGESLKTEVSGNIAYQHSRVSWGSDGNTRYTESLDVLQRQNDGSWLFGICAWNSAEGFDQV